MDERTRTLPVEESEARELLLAADGATRAPWDLDVTSVVRAASRARRCRRRARVAVGAGSAAAAVAVALLVVPGPLLRGAGPASDPSLAPQPEIEPAFLDLLAPLDGDAQVRAREGAELMMAQRLTDAVRPCMQDAGYGEYARLHIDGARDFWKVHSELASPTKLATNGLVGVADPELEDVPAPVREALDTCTAEGEAAQVAAAVDRFKVFRDSEQNPFIDWFETVRAEAADIAASEEGATTDYRQCFTELGVPADEAPDATAAVGWLIGDMVNRTTDFSPARIEAWQDGTGVLDADGGETARASAECVRQFQVLLTPRLEPARARTEADARESILEGQKLLHEALDTDRFDP